VLPLGNIALGLATVYGALALAWFLLFAADPRSGLLWALGPLLGPLGLLPLAAVLAQEARGPARRFAVAAASVLAAAGAAGLTASTLPVTGAGLPPTLGIEATDSGVSILGALVGFLGDSAALTGTTILLGLAAVAVPYAERRGPWGAALWGSGVLIGLVLGPFALGADAVAFFPLVLGVWAAALAVGVRAASARR
jgi:hypothetical protein